MRKFNIFMDRTPLTLWTDGTFGFPGANDWESSDHADALNTAQYQAAIHGRALFVTGSCIGDVGTQQMVYPDGEIVDLPMS